MQDRKRVTVTTTIETYHYFPADEVEGLDEEEIMELINDRPAQNPDYIEEQVTEVEDY